jgi:acyl dehydratase
MDIKLHSAAEIRAKIGTEIGVSDWMLIDQDMINRFADLTDDHQFIHVDPEMAAKTPFGGTIAHGFLVLSMLASLGKAASFAMQGVYMGVNYGFEKIRIMAPVRAGKRISASPSRTWLNARPASGWRRWTASSKSKARPSQL